MSATDLAGFVADVRARRVAAGRPEYITDEGVYRLLDGILAVSAAERRQKAQKAAQEARSDDAA